MIQKKAVEVMKALISSYLVTGIMLAIVAVAVLKFDMGESMVNISIIFTYIFSTVLGGLIVGKRVKEKKFFWGATLGISYVVVIVIASLLVNKSVDLASVNAATMCFMCLGGGMLGGMIA
ncbi:MAG: TIGR04086 family membrane protein [Lachnospiraceae bacterium]|nr:TIGR04086 family membrane protein [Lachnospiraceae bacterium]MEE1342932.1 TIGR04086 family membrane protein [Lachnospiraceae bacterium]